MLKALSASVPRAWSRPVGTEVEVGLGLSPKVVPHLRIREHLSEEEQFMLLEETRERKLVNTILTSLFKASAAHKKLNFKKFSFSDMELELSILPSVVLKFRPKTEMGDALSANMDLVAIDTDDGPESPADKA